MISPRSEKNRWHSLHRRVWTVRRKLWRVDWSRPRVHNVHGTPIIVLPNVFDGVLIRTGVFLGESVEDLDLRDARVLDLGCGSGIGSVFAARRGARAIATDINPEAARNAQINALALHLEQSIETRVGDLFEPVRGERFDVILFNPPYYRAAPRDAADAGWRSLDAFERFVHELLKYLNPNGLARVVLSTDGDLGSILKEAPHLESRMICECNFNNEVLTVFEIKASEHDVVG